MSGENWSIYSYVVHAFGLDQDKSIAIKIQLQYLIYVWEDKLIKLE